MKSPQSAFFMVSLKKYKDTSGRKLQNDNSCNTEKVIFDDRIMEVLLF